MIIGDPAEILTLQALLSQLPHLIVETEGPEINLSFRKYINIYSK